MRWHLFSHPSFLTNKIKSYWIAIVIFVVGLIFTFLALYVYQPTVESSVSFRYGEILMIGIGLSSLTAGYCTLLINRRLMIQHEISLQTEKLTRMNRFLQKEIGERHRVEEVLKKRQRYLRRRHEALIYLTQLPAGEIKKDLRILISKAASVMEVDRVSIWFFDPPPPSSPFSLSCLSLYDSINLHSSAEIYFFKKDYSSYFNSLKNQTHLIIPSNDLFINKELKSYLTTHHVLSKMDIPIFFEGRLLGILAFESTKDLKEWQLEDRHFGQTLAELVALKLEQDWRKKTEQALREGEQQLRLITQTAIDAIISVSDNEQIISWNFGAEDIFGYKEKEILGQSLSLILPEQKEKLFSQDFKTEELMGKNKEGHFFPVEISQTHWTKENESFYTLIIRDITERKEHERKLIAAIREANEANQAKDEFLATISHELRTPLNAIIGFNQCLLAEMDGPITTSQQVSLQKIEQSAFNLLHLINDLLDLAKIESNLMEINRSDENLVELMSSCIEEMQPLANNKQLPISLNVQNPLIKASIDPHRIRQVFLNLLGNAIKFTEKGSIDISIVEQEDGIEICVKDTGIGISPHHLSKVFKPFSQADSSITRKYGGTGLGLAISQKIIDLHKGSIWIESEQGKGSIFRIFLPKLSIK